MMQRSLYYYYYFYLTLAYRRWKFGTRRRTLPHLAGKITTQTRRQTVAKIDAHVLVIPTHVHNSSRFFFFFCPEEEKWGGNIAGPPPPDHRFLLLPTLSVTGRCGSFFYLHRLLLRPRVCASLSVCARMCQLTVPSPSVHPSAKLLDRPSLLGSSPRSGWQRRQRWERRCARLRA